MSDQFDACLPFILQAEGGYSDNPNDPGNYTGGRIGVGELRGTQYGISAASYPTLDIKNITIPQAGMIYLSDYWLPMAAGQMPGPIALVAFDSAVNQGVGATRIMLQGALGVAQDGIIGPHTVAAAVRAGNNPMPVVISLCARRAVRYAGLDMKSFGLGWMTRLFQAVVAAQKIGT